MHRIAPVQNQPVMGVALELGRNDALQRQLDFERIFARRQARAIADAKQMRIDRNGRLAERDIQNNIRGLAPDAGQRLKFLARARHLAAMLRNQPLRQRDDVFRLGPKQPDGLDDIAQAIFAERRASPAAYRRWETAPRVALLTPASVA